MEGDRRAIAKMLDMPEKSVRIDRYSYTSDFPDEVTAWALIRRDNPELRRYQANLYYPPSALTWLIDLVTELLFRLRFDSPDGVPGIVANNTRFRKPVMPDIELLIRVKLLRNYKGKIGIFSGVIADENRDIVAENISKGTIITI